MIWTVGAGLAMVFIIQLFRMHRMISDNTYEKNNIIGGDDDEICIDDVICDGIFFWCFGQ